MGFFDRFGKKPGKEAKVFKRSYSGANTGRLFADFKASERSADSELKPVLKVLRSRSRDLVRNNEYAKRYVDLLKTNVIGQNGFKLQVKAADSTGKLDQAGNQALESAFSRWGKLGNCSADGKMSWVDVQKMAIESLARDGEVFIVKHRNAAFKDSFALEFIEADQIDEEKNEKFGDGREIRMGVELDKFRRPVAYHMIQYHPGDYDFTTQTKTKKTVRIPADRMLHIFMPLRAGQTRGEPWMSPALAAIKQLGAFREAAIVNARVGASKMGFFTSPAGDGFIGDDMDGNVPLMDAEPGTLHQLPQGVEFQSWDPQYPNSEFDSFHKSVLKGVASALGVSYTSLSNDLEATSYSSIRQGALEERDSYRSMQTFMTEHLIRPIYETWLASAMEMRSFNIPISQYEKFADASNFQAKAWSWIDPLKEMNAAVVGMKNGVMSISDVANQYGKDVEDLMAQIQRDKSIAEQYGVTYALEPYAGNLSPVPPEGMEEEVENAEGQSEV